MDGTMHFENEHYTHCSDTEPHWLKSPNTCFMIKIINYFHTSYKFHQIDAIIFLPALLSEIKLVVYQWTYLGKVKDRKVLNTLDCQQNSCFCHKRQIILDQCDFSFFLPCYCFQTKTGAKSSKVGSASHNELLSTSLPKYCVYKNWFIWK